MDSACTKILVRGLGASPGEYRGIIRILKADIGRFPIFKGEIIVLPFATPFHTFVILRAGAIITDRGGITSHAAVIAREMGIPCIVGTENATLVLRDGMEVVVDGNRGCVYQP